MKRPEPVACHGSLQVSWIVTHRSSGGVSLPARLCGRGRFLSQLSLARDKMHRMPVTATDAPRRKGPPALCGCGGCVARRRAKRRWERRKAAAERATAPPGTRRADLGIPRDDLTAEARMDAELRA